jgi:hypothetical protein
LSFEICVWQIIETSGKISNYFLMLNLDWKGLKVASWANEVGVVNPGAEIEEPPGPPTPSGAGPTTVKFPMRKSSTKIDELNFEEEMDPSRVNPPRNRYPFCIVWTPIPLLT